MVMGKIEVNLLEEGRERLSDLLYVDDLVLCAEKEGDMKVMVVRFGEICRIRGLKDNADKSNAMVLGGEEGLECEVRGDGVCFV